MQVPMLDLKAQYETIKTEIEPAVLAVCASQQFVLGESVSRFEANIARYCQCDFAVGVSSGTDALICGLMAMGLTAGDEVIVPTFTFFGSAGAIARLGARPVFVDVDPETFNIDLNRLEEAITDKTKAIMPVHLYGQMAPMNEIMALAKRHDLFVVEDACQSIGSKQNLRMPGELGDCACLSFYPSKNLAGFGDGGLILCKDEQFAQKCKYLRMHGEDKRYYHSMVGGNFRLDALQAAVLDIKLKYLDGWAAKRQGHAAIYDRLLNEPVRTPVIAAGNESVYNQYVIRVPDRDQLQRYLKDKGIGSAVYYPVPLHLQECFEYLGGKVGDMPVAERLCGEVLAIPVYPELADDQIEYVAACINEFYGGKK